MADDVIRLDLELNSDEARRNAQRFIKRLEDDFKRAQKALEDALAAGVVGAEADENVKRLAQEVRKAERELNKFKRTVGDTRSTTRQLAGSLANVAQRFAKIATIAVAAGLTAVSIAFGKLTVDAVRATANLEQAELALRSLTAREFVQEGRFDSLNEAFENSTERANELLDTLFELARQSPFSREQIISAFRLAQAYGFTSDEALRLTQATADLAAGTGQSAEVIDRIALAFGQIQARGSLAGSELRQLQEAGFAANDVLEDLGFTLEDVSAGLVSADVFLEAAQRRIEQDFGGAAARATNTLQGLSSTLGDLRADALIAFFRPAIETLQPLIADFAANFDDLQPSIENAGEAFNDFINAIVENAPDAITVLDSLTKVFNRLESTIEALSPAARTLIALFGGFEEQTQNLIVENLQSAESISDLEREYRKIIDAQDQLIITGAFTGGEDVLPVAIEETARQVALQSDTLVEFTQNLRNLEEARREAGGREELSLFLVTGEDIESQLEFFRAVNEQAEALAILQAEEARLAGNRELLTQQTESAIQREDRLKDGRQETADATNEQAEAERELIIELVKSQREADKNAIAIFEQAEAAGASSEQLRSLAIELGLLTDEQIAAQQALDELVIAFINGEISAAQFKIEAADLNNTIAGTSLATAQAAISINALNDAFSRAISPQRRRGGGRADTTERDTLLQEAADIEAQAEAIESAVSRFGEIARLDADALQELVENSRDFTDELFDLTQQAGASIDTLIELGVATGEFTEEQAQASLEVIRREQGLRAIAESLANQTINTEQATEAAAELNRQIAEGEQVDLSAFGIDVAALETDQVPALLRETAQATREAAEALTQIAGALGGVTDGSESLAEAIKRETAQKKLNEAQTLRQRLEAIALADAFDLLTEKEREQTVQLALLDELALRNILSGEQLSQALTLVADEGFTVAEALDEIGVSADEIPDDIEILIDSNSDEVLEQVSAVNDALNELDGREATVQINAVVAETGGEAIGAGGLTEFKRGGFTGGQPDQVRGIVHGQELVVPQNVLRSGIPAIAAFAANNVPNLRSTVALANATPVQSAVVPSSTVINTTSTSGDTITNNNGGDSQITNNFFGVAGREIARSAFNTQFNMRQNDAMKRNTTTTALT